METIKVTYNKGISLTKECLSKEVDVSVYIKGDSAYQIAVQNGFVGTEQEWLESLKGEDGLSSINRYVLIFESGTSFSYELSLFGFDISTVTFYKPNGEEVSVFYNLSDKLYISSNIDLLNHKMIIN